MWETGCLCGLLCLLLPVTLSQSYSLKNCSSRYRDHSSADVFLDCTGRRLLTVPDDLTKDATSVNLLNNQIHKITKRDFHQMTKLKFLGLRQNRVSSVEDGSFSDLVCLTELHMMDNNLSSLSGGVFQGLHSLTLLDLSCNWIGFIQHSAFQALLSLHTLDLSSNRLESLRHIQPVLQLPQIHTLNLELNGFSSFESKDLQLSCPSQLRELALSGDSLRSFSISTPVFPKLQRIELSMLNMELSWGIPEPALLRSVTRLLLNQQMFSFEELQRVLRSLGSLTHLRLVYFQELIQMGILSVACSISSLRRLDLFKNDLSGWRANFTSCSRVRDLDLREANISVLLEGSLQPLKQLRSLNASLNQLSSVPYDIRTLSSLQVLHLEQNLIFHLDCEDFENTTLLSELYLSSNDIVAVDACVFANLAHLKLLDLSNNHLRTLKATFDDSKAQLQFLDISQNSIKWLEAGDFQGLESLRRLDAASDKIQWVPYNTFYELINLETLIVALPPVFAVDFSGLQHLQDLTIYMKIYTNAQTPKHYQALSQLTSLKKLTVECTEENPGATLDVPAEMLQAMTRLETFKAVKIYLKAPDVDTFRFIPGLKSLTLAKTDLSDLAPELFLPIPNLQALELPESSLRSLDFLLGANLSALRYLKLTDNQLTVINETLFSSLPSLTYLDLSNNPFSCECSNAGFIRWAKANKQTQVVNAHQYQCSFPLHERGRFLMDFDIQSCWDGGSFLCFVSSTCLVLLTLLSSFIHHFLRWQLTYTFRLFQAFLYDSRKRKKGDRHQFDAFVSYNLHDEDWVYRELVPVLEGEQGWRLCLHHRDFQPGKAIMENITDAIYGSRKTLCVISRHYLQSEWCSREIQMASFRLFDEKKDVLVLLFLEEIPARHLSPFYRMRRLVKRRSYLSWPQAAQHAAAFWHGVHRALQTGGPDHPDPLIGP